MTNLQAVVDIQAGNHHEESVGVNTTDESLDDVGVPRLVCVVHQAVPSICEEQRHRNDVKVAERNLIILLGLLLSLGKLVLVLEDNNVGQEPEEGARRWRTQADINCLGNLPELQKNTEALAGKNHP